jgi:hypothetical protein
MSLKQFVGPTCIETVSGKIIDLSNIQPEDISITDIAWALSRIGRFGGHSMTELPYSVAQHTVQVSRYVEEALIEGTPINLMVERFIDNEITKAVMGDPTTTIVDIENNTELRLWSDRQDTLRHGLDHHKRQQHALHGLMHDFAEAYLIDVPTPVKRLPGIYEAYRAAEEKIDLVIFKTLGLGYADKWHGTRDFGEFIVKWCDMLALKVEAYHLMPSRGMSWNLPLEDLDIDMLRSFVQPALSEQAYKELLIRFDELKPAPEIY